MTTAKRTLRPVLSDALRTVRGWTVPVTSGRVEVRDPRVGSGGEAVVTKAVVVVEVKVVVVWKVVAPREVVVVGTRVENVEGVFKVGEEVEIVEEVELDVGEGLDV